MKGQYLPADPTLLPGELYIARLDQEGRLMVSIDGNIDVGTVTVDNIETVQTIVNPVTVTGSVITTLPNPGNPGSGMTIQLNTFPEFSVPTVGSGALPVAAFPPITGFLVQALDTNTVPVYLGSSGVTVGDGIKLIPGASIDIPILYSDRIHSITTVVGQKLRVLGI